jgi:hypothetical protein
LRSRNGPGLESIGHPLPLDRENSVSWRTNASIAFFGALCCCAGARAAHDLETAPQHSSGLELIVVEAEGCIYCPIFRRGVLPLYQVSPRAREVPLRFADVNDLDRGPVALERPIEVVPTVLVLKNNREIGRVSGYLGPENFLHAIERLIAPME